MQEDNNENNAVNADGTNSEAFSSEFSETIQETGSEADEIEWNEITEEGVNEELFLENLDTELLVKIAGNIRNWSSSRGRHNGMEHFG